MVLERLGVHDDVVDIDVGVVDHVREGHVYSALEGCRGIGKSERHNRPLERAVAGLEGGLRFISLPDSDLVEATRNVYLYFHDANLSSI